jgi:hypothetical protein
MGHNDERGASRAPFYLSRRQRGAAAFVVSAAVLSACCVSALAEDRTMNVLARATSGPMQCEIRKHESNGAVELSGVITSSRALAGNFRFTVTKSGPSGSSDVHQGNTFDLAADQESQIGQVTINRDRDAHVAVELFVGSDQGLECWAAATLQP